MDGWMNDEVRSKSSHCSFNTRLRGGCETTEDIRRRMASRVMEMDAIGSVRREK